MSERNGRRIPVIIGGVSVLVVVGFLAVGLTSKHHTSAAPVTPGPVATMHSGPATPTGASAAPTTTAAPSTGPSVSPSQVTAPSSTPTGSQDEQPVSGLLGSLTNTEVVAAVAYSQQAVVALTTQVAGEDRPARLKLLFTAGSSGSHQPGPIEGQDSTVTPRQVESFQWAEPGNDTELRALVQVRYERSSGAAGYGYGSAAWDLRLVRSGATWLVSDVTLTGSTG